MLQSCFLKIANSQDWVDGFLISQSLWVKQALEHIPKPSWFHNSCKQNFCVTKSPKIYLNYQFHIWVTVAWFFVLGRKTLFAKLWFCIELAKNFQVWLKYHFSWCSTPSKCYNHLCKIFFFLNQVNSKHLILQKKFVKPWCNLGTIAKYLCTNCNFPSTWRIFQ